MAELNIFFSLSSSLFVKLFSRCRELNFQKSLFSDLCDLLWNQSNPFSICCQMDDFISWFLEGKEWRKEGGRERRGERGEGRRAIQYMFHGLLRTVIKVWEIFGEYDTFNFHERSRYKRSPSPKLEIILVAELVVTQLIENFDEKIQTKSSESIKDTRQTVICNLLWSEPEIKYQIILGLWYKAR